MQIIGIVPVHSAGNAIARVNVNLGNGVRLFNLKLSRKPSGEHRIYAPSAFGSSTANFSPEIGTKIVRLALAALGDIAHANCRD